MVTNKDFLYVLRYYEKNGTIPEDRYEFLPRFYKDIADRLRNGGRVHDTEADMKRYFREHGWFRCYFDKAVWLLHGPRELAFPLPVVKRVLVEDMVIRDNEVLFPIDVLPNGPELDPNWPLWMVDDTASRLFV